MNHFKVTFADGNSLTTGMNATLDEAKAYYIGKEFNFGDTDECPKDRMVKAVNVEELNEGPIVPNNFQLSFCAQGSVKQTIEMTGTKFSPQEIIDMLNSGEAATTVQTGGDVTIVATGEVIGKVGNVDNELEYFEFDAVT